jgi:transcriptional regulator with XRE-family HTH domain
MAKKQLNDRINRIKEVLVNKDVTQKWLSERLGRDPNTVAKFCNNKTQPHLKDLKRIAEILNVNIKDLLYDTPVK